MNNIINPLERFTKNELNKKGYKLAFFDSCVLYDLINSKDSEFNEKTKNTIERYKNEMIRPVVNQILFSELLSGLDQTNKDYLKRFQNKKLIMEFFNELKALWILSHDEILTFEFVHAYMEINHHAHDSFSIFSNCPLVAEVSINCERPYFGDKIMNYSYKLCEVTGTFTGLLQAIIQQGLQIYQEVYHNAVLKNNKAKEDLLRQKENSTEELNIKNKKDIDKGHISHFLKCHYINCELNRVEKLINFLYNSSKVCRYLSNVPFYSIENEIYWDFLKNKKKNDFIDSMHARTALSYCDYWITSEEKLKVQCKEVIKKMRLNVKCEI